MTVWPGELVQRTWRGSSSLATASWMMFSASATVPCSRANCSSRSFCFSCSSWLDYMNAHRNIHWKRTYACLSFHRSCTDIQKLDCWRLYQNISWSHPPKRRTHRGASLSIFVFYVFFTSQLVRSLNQDYTAAHYSYSIQPQKTVSFIMTQLYSLPLYNEERLCFMTFFLSTSSWL